LSIENSTKTLSLKQSKDSLKKEEVVNTDLDSRLKKATNQLTISVAINDSLSNLLLKPKNLNFKAINETKIKLQNSLKVLKSDQLALEFVRLNIRFSSNGQYLLNINGKILNSNDEEVRFDDIHDNNRNIAWTAYLANGSYKVILNDKKYKLLNGSYDIKFAKSDVNNGFTLITIPLEVK